MRKGFGVLLTLLALVWAVPPVEACYNDKDTQKEEQRFRSLYPDAPAQPQQFRSLYPDTLAQPSANGGYQTLAYGGSGLGIAMLAVAGYVGFGRRSS